MALAQERIREFDDAYRTEYRLGASSTVNSTKKKLMENFIFVLNIQKKRKLK